MPAPDELLSLFSLESPPDLPAPRTSPAYHASSIAFLESIHRRRSDALKTIIGEQGWPTAGEGDENDEAVAFIIVHHSDYDPKFQRACHALMLELVAQGYRKNLGFLAYLTDRILCNAGKHQRFGTQIREAANGCFVPKPIEDSDIVDQLRARVGLPETLFEYMQRINSGDMVLYRPLISDYADALEYNREENVIPFPSPHH